MASVVRWLTPGYVEGQASRVREERQPPHGRELSEYLCVLAAGRVPMEIADEASPRDCLIVLLRPKVALAFTSGWPIESFRVDDMTYRDSGLGDWTGFYDWLRNPAEQVVGVRYWPADPHEALFAAARRLCYSHIEPAGALELRFSEAESINPQSSNDQEFLYDAVFRSTAGEWAIAFDTAALERSDLEHIRGCGADWLSLNDLVRRSDAGQPNGGPTDS
jgi:hypothetical protein